MLGLDARFGISRAGSTVRREIGAGLVTFLTLSYVLFVQPAVLGPLGMDRGGVLFATCVASALACFLMAALAGYPIALAPAMGHNFFFAFTVCGAMGFTWQQALAANLLAGLLFLAIAGTRLREAIMHAIPEPLLHGLTAGIGLMIALLGLQWGNLVVDHPVTLVQLGDLSDPVALLALGGLVATAGLMVLRVPGAILLGLLGTAVAGWLVGVAGGPQLVRIDGLLASPPAPAAAFRLDFGGLLALPVGDVVSVLLTLLILDLFDTAGTLLGVASRAGLLRDGRLPHARGAFAADAAGTVVGACLGTSTVTSYVESAAGVAAGGRTGLTAVTVGLCMLASLFFGPLVEAVGAGFDVDPGPGTALRYPVIAPVLIIIGALMMAALRDVDWDDLSAALPAFLTAIIIPLAFSITDGIAWGMASYSLLGLLRRRRVPWLVHVLAAMFVVRYMVLLR